MDNFDATDKNQKELKNSRGPIINSWKLAARHWNNYILKVDIGWPKDILGIMVRSFPLTVKHSNPNVATWKRVQLVTKRQPRSHMMPRAPRPWKTAVIPMTFPMDPRRNVQRFLTFAITFCQYPDLQRNGSCNARPLWKGDPSLNLLTLQ